MVNPIGLILCNFEQLQECIFAPGNLYIQHKINGSEQFIKIYSEGELLTPENFTQWKRKGWENIWCSKEHLDNLNTSLADYWEHFFKSTSLSDEWHSRYNLLSYYRKKGHEHDLSLTTQILWKKLNKLNPIFWQQLRESQFHWVKRSLLVATNSCLLMLALGYSDIHFYRDIFHLALLMDAPHYLLGSSLHQERFWSLVQKNPQLAMEQIKGDLTYLMKKVVQHAGDESQLKLYYHFSYDLSQGYFRHHFGTEQEWLATNWREEHFADWILCLACSDRMIAVPQLGSLEFISDLKVIKDISLKWDSLGFSSTCKKINFHLKKNLFKSFNVELKGSAA